MSEGVCSDCPYGTDYGCNDGQDQVQCHHINHANVVFAHDFWCSEHPLRRRHILAQKVMVKLTFVNELSVATSEDAVARAAYQYADAMIAEAARRISVGEEGVPGLRTVGDFVCPKCHLGGALHFGGGLYQMLCDSCGYKTARFKTEEEAWAAWRGEVKP